MSNRSIYSPKLPTPRTVTLTALAQRIWDAATKRTGQSRSNVIEHLIRNHAGSLTRKDFARLEQAAAAEGGGHGAADDSAGA